MLVGDMYIGQQAFGGARASGTNDKAGSSLNLIRWVSPRTIKESFVPIEQVAYPSNSI
jgi:1-pyrroline-5-carboxylate dehydrogenase